MKVLLVAPTFGVHGGIEAFVLALADWLMQHTPHQIRVCFKLVDARAPSEALASGCRRLDLDVQFVQRGGPGLVRCLHWADVVHGNNCSPDVVLAAKLFGKPVVLTVHNWFRGKHGLQNRVWLLCNRIAERRLYNSTFVWRTWEPEQPLEGSELMPTVSHLPQVQAPFEARKGFCFVARLIANKGLESLVDAYDSATLDKAEWPLHIAGDGPLRGWLEQHLAERRSAGIRYLGFITEEDKHELIAHSKWLVAPANTREDMGLTPIEARNVAVPSIVTNDGGLPESAGESALLCEPGDVPGLKQLLEHAAAMPEAEYRRRALAARDTLKVYLRPLTDYPRIYEEIARRRRVRGELGAARE